MVLQKQKNEKIIDRAKNYPFDIPKSSYVYINGKGLELVDLEFNSLNDCTVLDKGSKLKIKDYLASREINLETDFSDRFVVLGYGSNSSLQQLHKKFSNFSGDVIIPVVKAQFLHFDIVYSAHISSYGSIPATLQYSPKTSVETFVTYLSELQLHYMHKTEALGRNYCLGKLFDIQLILENHKELHEALAYLSLHNCLILNDSPIALSVILSKGRMFPQMVEAEVLAFVRDIVDKDKNLDNFILENIENPEIRNRNISFLRHKSKKFSYDHWEVYAS